MKRLNQRKALWLCLCIGFVLFPNLTNAQHANVPMAELIKKNFEFAQTQYKYMMTLTPQNRLPQSYEAEKDKFIAYGRTWWCTGFYPGSLWYIYEQTKDETIKKEAERALAVIEPNQTFTGNHDLGFMMYCSFGNAYRITKDKRYVPIILTSSNSLATRYRPSIKAIQSWDKSKNFNCPVIIDNMMNLEMLLWSAKNGGSNTLKDIAVSHANTTLKNHFHPDFSSYHVLDYNLETGNVDRKKTWQGFSDSSAWARGQGWGLYGYTVMYRFTKNIDYLKHAKNIAHFILSNSNLPTDKIPYWDFNDPQIPAVPRDASAGALFASALLELGQYTKGPEKQEFVSAAETMLRSLSSDNYRAKSGTNGGYLLMHSTGALPMKSEIDVPLIYADYYFLEALKRYKDWYLK